MKALRACTATVFIIVLAASLLGAQLNRGVVEGTVTDPQGGRVAGATVSIRNEDTSVSTSSTTNETGYFRTVGLVPGKYLFRFTAPGFSSKEVTGLDVPAGITIRLDVELAIGAVQEKLEVSAHTEQVETSASNYSTGLGGSIIDSIPLQGRDLQQLVFLMPGVSNVGGPPGSNFGFNSQYGSFPDPTHLLGSAVAVNGGQAGGNAWYLDGSLNLSGFGENIVINPAPESVEEFQAITGGLAAEYGRTGGGIFNVVLKSGTNRLHGNLYEYDRNSVFNARNPFTSIGATGQIIPQDQLRYNDFGGTLGGPVVLPHIYDGRNRTFFFFAFDASILHLNGNQTFTVPTPLMRTGNFSEDPNVAQNGIYDPYTSAGPDVNGLFDRSAFGTPSAADPIGCLASHISASNGASCNISPIIPTNRLDPTAMFFINSFPQPNYLDPLSSCPLAASGAYRICNNFLGGVGSSQDPLTTSLKVDHRISDKDSLFGEWLFDPGMYNNYRVPWTGPTFPQGQVGFGSHYPFDFANTVIALGDTYTISPTLINEFRAAFTRQFLTTHPQHPLPNSLNDMSQVQQILAPSQIPLDPEYPIPEFDVGSMTFGLNSWSSLETTTEAYTITDNLTKVMGRHTLKTGFLYRLEHGTYESGVPTILPFSGGISQNPLTGLGGNATAQFMLGALSIGDYSFTGRLAAPYQSWRSGGGFLQDDLRVTRSLTLNIGLRYDIDGYWRTRYQPESLFCFSCTNSVGMQGKILYSGDAGFPRGNILPANKNSLGPRFNLAWAPRDNQKTVVRAGYDIIYTDGYENLNAPGQSAPNMISWGEYGTWDKSFDPSQCASFTGECVAWQLSSTTNKASLLNPPLTLPPAYAALTRAQTYSTYSTFTKSTHDPNVEQWTLDLQHAVSNNLSFDVAYVGSHATHLPGTQFFNVNYLSTANKLKYKTNINNVVPVTNYFTGAAAQLLGQVYADPTTGAPATELPLSTLLLPYPLYNVEILINNDLFDGTSTYNALNGRLQGRNYKGLDFILAYTWSKKIDNWCVGEVGTNVVDPIHSSRTGVFGGRVGAVQAYSGVFNGDFQDPDNRNADRAIAPDDTPNMLNLAISYQLPVGSGKTFLNRGGMLSRLLGGWRLSGNLNAQSGLPLAVTCPGNNITDRCDIVGNPEFGGGRSKEERIAQWMNPTAFEPPFGSDQSFWANYDPTDPRAWLFGTSGPRQPWLRGPGFWNLDSSLAKDFHISEDRYVQFRWEVLNTLNHMNLGLPNTGFCLPPTSDGSTDLVHQAGCQFGRITNIQTDPRAMEFSFKFVW